MKLLKILIGLILLVVIYPVFAQVAPNVTKTKPPKVIDFRKLAEYEKIHPPKVTAEDDDEMEKVIPGKPTPVQPNAKLFKVPTPTGVPNPNRNGINLRSSGQEASPEPALKFDGQGGGGGYPPDLNGAVGPEYVMEGTNLTFQIFTKDGSLAQSLGVYSFFQGADNITDNHIVYDRNNGRFIVSMLDHGISPNTLWVGVSKTSDPTGEWYTYNFTCATAAYDGAAGDDVTDDYPQLGYNSNWIVITTHLFDPYLFGANVYAWSRNDLYNGLGSTYQFQWNDDADWNAKAPARTYDPNQNTEYLVEDYNGNYNGNGYVAIGYISGPESSPIYVSPSANQISVNQTWEDNLDNIYKPVIPQDPGPANWVADDARMCNVICENNSLWFSHTVYLQGNNLYTGVDWWQVDASTYSLQQFGRYADIQNQDMCYFFPNLDVNSRGDIILQFEQSSATTDISAGYAFHAGYDPSGAMETGFTYDVGSAYYDPVSAGQHSAARWGDFTGAALDPSDNTFWVFGMAAVSLTSYNTEIAHVCGPQSTSDVYYQDRSVNSLYGPLPANTFSSSFITAGSDVTSSLTTGPVVVGSSQNVNFYYTTYSELDPGFSTAPGSQFNVQYYPAIGNNDCGGADVPLGLTFSFACSTNEITANVTGGVQPTSISWHYNGTNQSGNSITVSGDYGTVEATVTDAVGNTVSQSYTYNNPSPLSAIDPITGVAPTAMNYSTTDCTDPDPYINICLDVSAISYTLIIIDAFPPAGHIVSQTPTAIDIDPTVEPTCLWTPGFQGEFFLPGHTYTYGLTLDGCNGSTDEIAFTVNVTCTGKKAEADSLTAIDSIVLQNSIEVYPNPFDNTTMLFVTLANSAQTDIVLYDMLGREVNHLLNNSLLDAGVHSFAIKGDDLSAGIYNVALTVDGNKTVKKIVKVQN